MKQKSVLLSVHACNVNNLQRYNIVIINPSDQSSIQEKFSLVQKAFWYDTRQKKVQGKCNRTTESSFLWRGGGSEGERHDVFQMIQEVSNQKTIVCQDNLKLHFLLYLHYDMCFRSFCIGLIRYLFNCTGKWLQNSSTDKLICHWMVSNIIGPECSNLVDAASNVFACPGLDDGAVTSTLPADLVSTIIKRFSFEGNWILDLIRSKGSFSHIAST